MEEVDTLRERAQGWLHRHPTFYGWWFGRFCYRLAWDPWVLLVSEMLDDVHAGIQPAEGGGYWIRPVWRPTRFYLLWICAPLSWAKWFGYDMRDYAIGGGDTG